MNPLILNVADLLAKPNSQISVNLTADVDRYGDDSAWVEGRAGFALTAEAIDSESVQVTGTVTVPMTLECRRCLTHATSPLAVEVDEIYRPAHDVWEEGYEVSTDQEIDLGLLVRDAVVLELPLFPLCKPECAGLCPKCGVDRNLEPCSCDTRPQDLRWAALEGIELPAEATETDPGADPKA